MKKDQQILITGSEGFVGSHLRQNLPAESVTCLDRTKQSLFDIETLQPLLNNVDTVYHLAGVNAGSGFSPSPTELTKNNIEATYSLLEAIRLYCKKPPLVVIISTIHVYEKTSTPLVETSNLGPASIYGLSKLSQEYLIRQATQQGIIRSVVFRASNVYGKGSRPGYNSAIATFCQQVRDEEEISLFANGHALLDLIYVEDVVNCLLQAIHFEKAKGWVYNLASSETITVGEIVNILGRVSGKQIKTKMVDSPAVEFSISIDKLKQAYPGFSLVTIDEGLKRMYNDKA